MLMAHALDVRSLPRSTSPPSLTELALVEELLASLARSGVCCLHLPASCLPGMRCEAHGLLALREATLHLRDCHLGPAPHILEAVCTCISTATPHPTPAPAYHASQSWYPLLRAARLSVQPHAARPASTEGFVALTADLDLPTTIALSAPLRSSWRARSGFARTHAIRSWLADPLSPALLLRYLCAPRSSASLWLHPLALRDPSLHAAWIASGASSSPHALICTLPGELLAPLLTSPRTPLRASLVADHLLQKGPGFAELTGPDAVLTPVALLALELWAEATSTAPLTPSDALSLARSLLTPSPPSGPAAQHS